MNCEWVRENIVLHVYNELEDDARHELEQHLACGAVRAASQVLLQFVASVILQLVINVEHDIFSYPFTVHGCAPFLRAMLCSNSCGFAATSHLRLIERPPTPPATFTCRVTECS